MNARQVQERTLKVIAEIERKLGSPRASSDAARKIGRVLGEIAPTLTNEPIRAGVLRIAHRLGR